MKKYILIVFMGLATFIDCISQDVETNIKLQGSNLSIEISITNNTKLPIYIPLSDWVLSQNNNMVGHNLLPTYHCHIISNFKESKREYYISLVGHRQDLQLEKIPKLLKIDVKNSSQIIIEIDTLSLMKNWPEKLLESDFDFRLSVADFYVLTDLFGIMNLNLENFTINDSIVTIPLKHDKYTWFSSSKYISKTKLRGDYKRLIRLPFFNYIEFSGKLQR